MAEGSMNQFSAIAVVGIWVATAFIITHKRFEGGCFTPILIIAAAAATSYVVGF